MDVTAYCDVWRIILSYLPLESVLNVSLTCKRLHDLSLKFSFERLHLTWSELNAIAAASTTKNTVPDARIRYLKHLSVEGDTAWQHCRALPDIDAMAASSIHSLDMKCVTAAWFKYIEKPLAGVTKLRLTLANDGGLFYVRDITQVLPNLEVLSLGNEHVTFKVMPDPEGGMRRLRHLEVVNCFWEYPDQLCDAARNGPLNSLSIKMASRLSYFAYSERLRNEMVNLPATLKHLTIESSPPTRVNWNPLNGHLPLPELQSADLRGFMFMDRSIDGKRKAEYYPSLVDLREA